MIVHLRLNFNDAHVLFSNSIPRNRSFVISLKQEVTISGLGVEGFEAAARGVLVIYQGFQARVSALNGQLREWSPTPSDTDLTLTFGNRYLTRNKEIGNDEVVDISHVVDPFNVLRPLLRLESHTSDNVVEYWERHFTESKYVILHPKKRWLQAPDSPKGFHSNPSRIRVASVAASNSLESSMPHTCNSCKLAQQPQGKIVLPIIPSISSNT